MADPPSSPATMESNQPDNPNPNPDSNTTDPLPVSSTSTPPPPPPPSSTPAPVTANPSPNNPSIATPPPPPAMLSYTPPPISVMPPTAPSFRPAPPQFSLLPTPQNLAYQNALNSGVQPPGVSHGPVMVPGMATGAVSATVSMPPMMNYQIQPGQPPNPAMRPYMTMPNGYGAMPVNAPQGTLPPPVS